MNTKLLLIALVVATASLVAPASAALRGSSAGRTSNIERILSARRALKEDCIKTNPYCACTEGNGCNADNECDGCIFAGACVKTQGVDANWCRVNKGQWCTPVRTAHIKKMRCGKPVAPKTKPADTCACTSGPACTGLVAGSDATGKCNGCMIAGEKYCVTKGTPEVTRQWCEANKGDWCFLAENMLADVEAYIPAYAAAYVDAAMHSKACVGKIDTEENPETHKNFGEVCYSLGRAAEMEIRASAAFQADAEASASADAEKQGCRSLPGKWGDACYEAKASAEADVRAKAMASASLTLDNNGFSAQLQAAVEIGATASAQASVSAEYDVGPISMSTSTYASVTAEAAVEVCAEAGVDVGKDGVSFFAEGAAGAHATASAEAGQTFGANFGGGWTVEGETRADARVGVWAEADGHAGCDAKAGSKQGCDVGGSVGAGAGAEASVEAKVDFGGCASASGGIGGEAGGVIGAGGSAHAGRDGCRISAGAEGDVAAVLGAEIDWNVEFDPCCMANKIKHWIEGTGKKIAKGARVAAEKTKEGFEKAGKETAKFAKRAVKEVGKDAKKAGHEIEKGGKKVVHWFKHLFGRRMEMTMIE
jgi:hypothetical protein